MNTAIHAAHNLVWKLVMVLRGTASPALLDTYERERRPSGERNLLRSRGQLQGVSGVAADLGVVYVSAAVVSDHGMEAPPVIEPTAPLQVGARAPHVWLDADGEPLSTHDLFGHGFVLLTGPRGATWLAAARNVCALWDVPLGAIAIGGAELRDWSGSWLTTYGIDADGAVLIRPDGHIAWRSASSSVDATATLHHVVARVLGVAPVTGGQAGASFMAGVDRRSA